MTAVPASPVPDAITDWVRKHGSIVVELTTPTADARAIFTAMTREQLEAQAHKWWSNAGTYAAQRDAARPAADALVADAEKRLDRVKRLLSSHRKTVAMADLRTALFTEDEQ